MFRSRDAWFTDDTPVQPENEHGTQPSFRKCFRYFQARGKGEWFLSAYRGMATFAADVQWAEEQMVRELDVVAGD